MNKARRNEIYKIIDRLYKILHALKNDKEYDVTCVIMDIIEMIQVVFDEEECVMENIPENLQSGYRYQESEEACDNLFEAIRTLEDALDDEDADWIDTVTDAIDCLNYII